MSISELRLTPEDERMRSPTLTVNVLMKYRLKVYTFFFGRNIKLFYY